jgi:hypothetical protein
MVGGRDAVRRQPFTESCSPIRHFPTLRLS